MPSAALKTTSRHYQRLNELASNTFSFAAVTCSKFSPLAHTENKEYSLVLGEISRTDTQKGVRADHSFLPYFMDSHVIFFVCCFSSRVFSPFDRDILVSFARSIITHSPFFEKEISLIRKRLCDRRLERKPRDVYSIEFTFPRTSPKYTPLNRTSLSSRR